MLRANIPRGFEPMNTRQRVCRLFLYFVKFLMSKNRHRSKGEKRNDTNKKIAEGNRAE